MLPLILALSLAFPIRTSPEVPVSDPDRGRVALSQSNARIASNGTLALAVWNDSRTGKDSVFASRVDRSGTPLDITGFLIRENSSVDDVFWDGETFVVLTGSAGDYELAFVDTEGHVVRRTPLAVNAFYATRNDKSERTRLLFLPADGYSVLATIVDLDGRVVKAGGTTNSSATVLAASRDSGFLVLRNFYTFTTAERLDEDGNVLTSSDTGLPPDLRLQGTAALTADGRGGFALIVSEPSGIVLHPLDDRGVASGPASVIQQPQKLERGVAQPVARPTKDGFIVSWAIQAAIVFTLTSEGYVSYSGGAPRAINGFDGDIKRTELDSTGTFIVTSCDDPYDSSTGEDVFVQGVGAYAYPDQPLTESAMLQTNAAIAAGENGFLVAWSENNRSNVFRYVRRFTPNGDVQGSSVFFVPHDSGPPSQERLATPLIASSGDTYLVVWDDGWAGRVDAKSGDFADFVWRLDSVDAIASNGTSFLAIRAAACIRCEAQRIELRGTPVVSPAVLIPGTDSPSHFAIASNGTDYLVVWANRGAPQIVAMRLRADGTSIDSVPYVLGAEGDKPSVAWNGETYLATWSKPGGDIGAAYVSSQGGVEQLGTIAHATEAKSVAHAGQFLILTRTVAPDDPSTDEWRGMTLGGEATSIVKRSGRGFGTLGAASNGVYLMLAYDRVDDANGHIGRVFLDSRVFQSRRRAARGLTSSY